MGLINRPEYLEKLIGWKDKNIVKVITGIRRCGKSTLFALYRDWLGENGINDDQIQSFNMESVANADFAEDYGLLHRLIERNLVAGKMNYIFIDEIQQIRDAQKLLASLALIANIDLYVTGSNTYLLSGEIATLLTGRYIEIHMLPFSFKEYVSAFPLPAGDQYDMPFLEEKYRDYVQNSSFPQTLEFRENRQLIFDYLSGLYNTIVQRDILNRTGIKEPGRLDSVTRYLFSIIGSESSLKKISDTMSSNGRKIHPQTVESYVSALEKSFVFYKAGRFDIKGGQYLLTNAKYYCADIGMRNTVLDNQNADTGHILENIVYLELVRRGCRVSIGKIGENEVDFVAVKPGGFPEYYQVCQTVLDDRVKSRELKPLLAINDNYPKYLLTRDYEETSINGIIQKNALEWLHGNIL